MAATVFEVAGGCAIFPSTPFGSSWGACKACAAVSKRRCTSSTSSGQLRARRSQRPTDAERFELMLTNAVTFSLTTASGLQECLPRLTVGLNQSINRNIGTAPVTFDRIYGIRIPRRPRNFSIDALGIKLRSL